MKISRVKAIVIAAVFGLFSVAVSPAAAQDFPTSSFDVTFGNSFLRGHITWFNRSIGITYTIRSATGCKTAFVEAFDPQNNGAGIGVTACVGQGTKSDSFTIGGASPGGFSVADVNMVDESGAINASDLCERDFTVCINNDF